MALLWVKRVMSAAVLSVFMAGVLGAAALPRKKQWIGEVKPGSGWLQRQGLASSFPIRFTVDAAGRATGSMLFAGNIFPAAEGKAALKGERDPDGSAFYLFANIEGRHGLPPAAQAQAEVKMTLTGFDEEDGSLRGVGVIDMPDLACLKDPVRSSARTPCARRMVPVKWTAKR